MDHQLIFPCCTVFVQGVYALEEVVQAAGCTDHAVQVLKTVLPYETDRYFRCLRWCRGFYSFFLGCIFCFCLVDFLEYIDDIIGSLKF